MYLEDLQAGSFRVHHGVIDKRPGSLPNDPATFQVRDHVAMSIASSVGSIQGAGAGAVSGAAQ